MLRKLAVVISVTAIAALAATPSATRVPFEKAFVPLIFDSNDRSQVVLTGTYPHTCYQGGGVQFQVHKINRVIRVTHWAFVSPENCLPAIVPFHSLVELGRLDPGIYSIEDSVSGTHLGYLPVTPAKGPGPDVLENSFAPISNAYVEKDPMTGQWELILQGNWSDRCTQLKEVKLLYQRDVLVVQPITEHLEAEVSRFCGHQPERFQKRVSLRPMAERTFLLHVRTMDGNALNQILND